MENLNPLTNLTERKPQNYGGKVTREEIKNRVLTISLIKKLFQLI